MNTKKIIPTVLSLAICSTMVLPAFSAETSSPINIIINGKNIDFTEDSGFPYIDENQRAMVPLRVTMEACGAAVGYDADKRTAIVITDSDRIEVPIDTNYLYSNNKKIINDTNSVVKNGITYLPIAAVLMSAGYTVEWENDSKSVIAYNFNYDSDELVPYHTSSLETLTDRLLSGDVVYIDGAYYATPDYVRMLSNVQIHYLGDDLNTAIYPYEDSRYDLLDFDVDFDSLDDPTLDSDGITSDLDGITFDLDGITSDLDGVTFDLDGVQ